MLNCLYCNARSIINKFDFFETLVDVLNVDVIGITESWATSQILDSELSLSGFHICLLYTSPSPRDRQKSRMPSSA